jgi:hypothetical protein
MKLIKKWLLTQLFNSISVDEVITISKSGIVFINGVQITNSEKTNLRLEAELLEKTRLWKILTDTISDHAEKRMFINSTKWEDVLAGKMALYNISIIKNIVKLLQSIK